MYMLLILMNLLVFAHVIDVKIPGEVGGPVGVT
jgi:hypothetical protein